MKKEKRDIVILVVERVKFLGRGVWIDIQTVLSAWAGPRKKDEEETGHEL